MATGEAAVLRRELGRAGTRRGLCFSKELKQRAAVWIVKRRAAGATVSEIAAELRIADGTVLRWSAAVAATRSLLPVRVMPEPAVSGSVSVVSPSGVRVEGLTLAQAAALFRELG